jgi:hypothetical protein
MVDRSDLIVTGQVTRTWTAWDDQRQYIWTHNEIAAHTVDKGSPIQKVVVSEPGGVVDGVGMRVAGMPNYAQGEEVMLFLERMPNGYLRTLGLGQGKLRVAVDGRVHLTQTGADLIRIRGARPGTALESLEALPASQVRQLVTRLVQQRQSGRQQ